MSTQPTSSSGHSNAALCTADQQAALRARSGNTVKSFFHGLGLLVVLFCTLVPFLLVPFYWMVSTLLKTTGQIQAKPLLVFFSATFEHYRNILGAQDNVGGSLLVSLIVAVGATLLIVVLATSLFGRRGPGGLQHVGAAPWVPAGGDAGLIQDWPAK